MNWQKLLSTIRVLSCLFMARTFGRYIHSVNHPDGMSYAKYNWRGEIWAFPSQPKLNKEWSNNA